MGRLPNAVVTQEPDILSSDPPSPAYHNLLQWYLVSGEKCRVPCCCLEFHRRPSHSGFHLLYVRRRITPGGLAYQPAGWIRLPSVAALYGPANFSIIPHKNDIRSIEVSQDMVLHREISYPSRTLQISSLLQLQARYCSNFLSSPITLVYFGFFLLRCNILPSGSGSCCSKMFVMCESEGVLLITN
jgi:hypothetical protein